MTRKKIPLKIETKLLTKCRRRCCICFGLENDRRVKQGQIAHLDHDNSNYNYDNLAFLCLNHHDQYDSRTSQSKSITLQEVIQFKSELEEYIQSLWEITKTDTSNVKLDIFTGKYSRNDEIEMSTLTVTYLGGNKIHVKGEAYWGINREYGANIGQLDFVSDVDVNQSTFIDYIFGREYKLAIEFRGNKLIAKENNLSGYFGLNVSFDGLYFKND